MHNLYINVIIDLKKINKYISSKNIRGTYKIMLNNA